MAIGVAVGLICMLVDMLTRPSTELWGACLARFLGAGGLSSPGDRARTRADFSYKGG